MPHFAHLRSFIGSSKLLLCILLYNMIERCFAAPFDLGEYVDSHLSESEITALKVLKTVLLAYVSHAATVRPDQSTRFLPTLYKRMSALAWPTSGIYEAVGSIRKKMDGDNILGINKSTEKQSTKDDQSRRERVISHESNKGSNESDKSDAKHFYSQHHIERNIRTRTYQEKHLQKSRGISVSPEIKEYPLAPEDLSAVTPTQSPKTITAYDTISSAITVTFSDENPEQIRPNITQNNQKLSYGSAINETISENEEVDIVEKFILPKNRRRVLKKSETLITVYADTMTLTETRAGFKEGIYDNGDHLKKILEDIGPERAESLKKAILSGSIHIGCNTVNADEEYRPFYYKTKTMTIAGPGSKHMYQIPVHPKIIRYLSKTMLNQLKEATRLEESSHLPRFISLIQLGYTLYEIIRGSGDSWSKLILGIFTIMSILQTASLYFLPMQVSAFSIESDLERYEALCEELEVKPVYITDDELLQSTMKLLTQGAEKSERKHARIALHALAKSNVPSHLGMILFVEKETKLKGISTQPSGKWEYFVLSSGIVIPLLLGIIAGYKRHTRTEWIVLAWIISSIPFTFLRLFYLEPDYITKKSFPFATFLMVIPGITLIFVATVFSYMPV